MSKKAFLLIIFAVLAISTLCASGKSEKRESTQTDKKSELKMLEKSEKKWDRQKITSYKADIIYMRGTFPPEEIKITVADNTVTDWKTGDGRIAGRISTRWNYPVRITVAIPEPGEPGYKTEVITVAPGEQDFSLDY